MPLELESPVEVRPAVAPIAAVLGSRVRIRKLDLDMGSPDGAQPPVFTIVWTIGYMDGDVYTPVTRTHTKITDLAEIGAMLIEVPRGGDVTLAKGVERTAIEYLQSKGLIPGGGNLI